MPVPVELAFRGFDPGDTIRNHVDTMIAKLDRFEDIIVGARVTVESAHRHGHKHLLEIHVEVSLEKDRVFAKREATVPEPAGAHTVWTALSEAFGAVMRQIDDVKEKQRRQVKTHDQGPDRGRIARLNRDRRDGFIERADGNLLFFHDTVVEDEIYDRLETGDEVLYAVAEAESAYGPQARFVKRHGPEARRG
ncbi:MAG: cold shock domain-containing protein [Alphaproteobacteria bacterium]|jgi:cold shock CspA family protein|nr:cold shock domain-containing protein [Alphaproteobacteria bacterium]